jgi:hypothetical protein
MARPRTQEAAELLYKIARKYNTDPRSVIEGPRSEEYVRVKREFCEVAVKIHGMQPIMIADILGLHHTTVLHHAKPEMRERKRLTRTRGMSPDDANL